MTGARRPGRPTRGRAGGRGRAVGPRPGPFILRTPADSPLEPSSAAGKVSTCRARGPRGPRPRERLARRAQPLRPAGPRPPARPRLGGRPGPRTGPPRRFGGPEPRAARGAPRGPEPRAARVAPRGPEPRAGRGASGAPSRGRLGSPPDVAALPTLRVSAVRAREGSGRRSRGPREQGSGARGGGAARGETRKCRPARPRSGGPAMSWLCCSPDASSALTLLTPWVAAMSPPPGRRVWP